MSKFNRGVLFFLFFFSGFASLVYQVVWTRMAFMSFGIIVPVLSVVLSVFMLGLALGSWLGGKCIGPMVRKFGISAAFFYGGAEGIIGLGAFAVPHLFAFGAHVLLGTGEMNSFSYLLMSALALAIAIFPWCVCMGTTFPFMMAYVREIESSNVESFSFLYLANVLGAMWGTFYTAVVLVESLGFHHTLWVAAAANFFITFISLCLALERPKQTAIPATAINAEPSPGAMVDGAGPVKTVLFTTGFAAMAMEVVWSRAFTPQLKTQVYSFAMIVFAYLGATFVGSWLYRSHLRSRKVIGKSSLMGLLAISAFLPVICDDLRFVPANFQTSAWHVVNALKLLGGISPFCALLGYLTPSLIDEYSAGQPKRAGRAYAINVLGCILGPLVSCYILLPSLSERHALILLALPFVAFWLTSYRAPSLKIRVAFGAALAIALGWSVFVTEDFEAYLTKYWKNVIIRRDYAASVISTGDV